ncbi:MAG: hypothetical protein HY782_18695 [Chloroflexi bacterium]|nr:hypothetical protein [Chloroflexota bacterium]
MLKSNIVAAAIVGLILGVLAEIFFAFVYRVPVLGCLFTPVAFLFGFGLPVLIGALAASFGSARGWLSTPSEVLDGALAAALAELVSRLFGFCASLLATRAFFFGPRFLLPSVEPASRALFTGVWELGWLVLSLLVAALLGALGAFLYNVRSRR